ncbi:MAG: hypothetical protein D6720_13000 [Gammaproteobacteria bacterium]|nr:MAG: hypothetical protein D6720_13000 [Gammaproteobacteria bacterium]
MRHLLLLLTLCIPLARGDALTDGRLALQMADYAKARALLEPLAAEGNPRALFYLSLIYQEGLGVSEDPARAQALLRRAAEAGDPMAQYNLGSEALEKGTEAGARRAAELYRAAAVQGLVLAQHNLGSLYALGKGVPQNLDEARRWYRMAARNGSRRSVAALAELERLERKPVAQERAAAANASRLIVPDREWFGRQGEKAVTLQLLATSQRKEAEALYRRHQWQRDVLLYRIETAADEPLWGLGYGVFPSVPAARRAIAELPEALRRTGPWARNLRDLRRFAGH